MVARTGTTSDCRRANDETDTASTAKVTPRRPRNAGLTRRPIVEVQKRLTCATKPGFYPDSADTGSLAHVVADVGRLGSVDHLADVELDERGEHVEETATSAQQHRDLVDLDLVEDSCGEGSL